MTAETDREGAAISRHLIGAEATLADAMLRLDTLGAAPHNLFITDAGGRALGSLTDGDVRRALLRGLTPASPVAQAMKTCFTALRPGSGAEEVMARARALNLKMLPSLDAEGRLTGLLDLEKVRHLLPLDAVLMAGGRGERLMPLTDSCPKPLLEVGGKAIIDYNVEKLRLNGIRHVNLCLNYLHAMIEDHFAARHPDLGARSVVEEHRMGTFGALTLIPDWYNDDILVMNADLLSSLDIAEMYAHHRATGADATMAVAPYSVAVPFAIIETEGNFITGMKEKPTYNYYVNAGVYIIRRRLVGLMAPGRYLDAPDFLQSVIDTGGKVAYFPIAGTWIDIGTPEQYARACEFAAAALK